MYFMHVNRAWLAVFENSFFYSLLSVHYLIYSLHWAKIFYILIKIDVFKKYIKIQFAMQLS